MVDISKIDMNRIEGLLDKLDSMTYIVETGNNENGWYRKWSDGWIEQGGELATVNMDTSNTVNIPIPFTTKTYNVLVTALGGKRNNTQYTNGNSVEGRELTFFVMRTDDYDFGRNWYACGY